MHAAKINFVVWHGISNDYLAGVASRSQQRQYAVTEVPLATLFVRSLSQRTELAAVDMSRMLIFWHKIQPSSQ
jgi:hypothetical protein